VRWFPAELGPLLAVAAAALDERGILIKANAGFLRVALHGRAPAGADVSRCFIQPDFPTLLRSAASADGEIHNGLLTMGDPAGLTQTLLGRVWRENGKLCVLAEFDVEELGRLNGAVLELNREYADSQLELAQTIVRLRQREAEIVAISLTDPLTGVGNRRRLEQAMLSELSRVERTGEKLCVLMADVDHFKRVNDVYGHEVGDLVLTTLARLLLSRSRAMDVVARVGGEEFVVIMPRTELSNAALHADQLRTSLALTRIEPLIDPITMSIGVAELATGEPGEALLRRTDQALYEAKKSGRNRVVTG
jgi:two-component system cell cycle response regulator